MRKAPEDLIVLRGLCVWALSAQVQGDCDLDVQAVTVDFQLRRAVEFRRRESQRISRLRNDWEPISYTDRRVQSLLLKDPVQHLHHLLIRVLAGLVGSSNWYGNDLAARGDILHRRGFIAQQELWLFCYRAGY